MTDKLPNAQDFGLNGGMANAGFNRRVGGASWNECFTYQHERENRDLHYGFDLADKWINEGKIFYLHNFHHTHSKCTGHAFRYGGFWVCNTCCNQGVDRPWWSIKVFKDGNAWCCVGLGFENLQASENYAFGDTRDGAIDAYGTLMLSKEIAG